MLIVLLIKISLYFYSMFALVIFLLLQKKNSRPRQLTKETAFLASSRLGSLMVEWNDQAAGSVTGTRSWNLTSWTTPQEKNQQQNSHVTVIATWRHKCYNFVAGLLMRFLVEKVGAISDSVAYSLDSFLLLDCLAQL